MHHLFGRPDTSGGHSKRLVYYFQRPSPWEWDASRIHSPWSEVFHMAYDNRNGGRILSTTNPMIWRPQLEYTDNRVGT